VLVVINKFDLSAPSMCSKAGSTGRRAVWWMALCWMSSLHGKFASHDRLMRINCSPWALFPVLRVPIARHIINDTCFTNAAYSLSTGLAEIVPVLNIPLTLTDMIVLTKNQPSWPISSA